MITQISKLKVGRVNFHAGVDTVRDKKNMQFIVVKDFSGKIQLFIDFLLFFGMIYKDACVCMIRIFKECII